MQNVKILTINLHCLEEKYLSSKQRRIAKFIEEHDVDIICFQEVAQSLTSPMMDYNIRMDNYVLTIQSLLEKQQKNYHMYYEPIKKSFGKYDEGLALLSKHYLTFDVAKRISNTKSYDDWHTRYVFTHHVTIGQTKLYIANTHFGWTEGIERFEEQFDRAKETLPNNEIGILVGDFNVTPKSKEYKYIIDQGMIDLFDNKMFRKQPTYLSGREKLRIDYIMSNTPLDVTHQEIVFKKRRVSDHLGLYLEFEVK